MTNLIQIKRSLNTAVPASLANGELAYTANGDVLYIGSNGNVEAIGGKRNPGTLTANQALVANSTSGIDKIIVANLQPTYIFANGASGTAGQYLTSNSSGGVHWTDPTAGVAGSNTQIQFNDSGSLAGDAGLTFDKTTDTLSTNTLLATSTVNAATLSIGSSFIANSTVLTLDSTVGISANGSTGTAGHVLHSNGTAVYWATDDQGVTSVATGDGLSGGPITTTGTVSVLANSGIISNSTGVFVDATYISGLNANNATYLNGQLASYYTNASNITTGTLPWAQAPTGTVNTSGSFTFTGNETFSGNVTLNAGLIANGAVGTAGQVLHSDGTSIYWAIDDQGVTSVATGDGLSGGPITTTGTVSVLANNGIIANSSGIFADAANGISVDSSGINVTGGDGLVSNSSGVHVGSGNGVAVDTDSVRVVGGTGVISNSTGVHIGQDVATTADVTFANVVTTGLSVTGSVSSNVMPAANNTYHLGNTTIKWAQVHAANVHGDTGIFDGNLEVAGDLIVTGNVTTANVSSLIVGDAKILLAANNPGDIIDIGFSGTYVNGGATVRHAGLFRDASDNGVFKFFANTTQDLTGNNVIDTDDVTFALGTLQTYLVSSALISNSSLTNITANSTVSVAITANTLSLTTALAGTSGGTGKTTVTDNALLVGNSSNGYDELTLGTTGYVLQSNGSALVYDTLDGGTF